MKQNYSQNLKLFENIHRTRLSTYMHIFIFYDKLNFLCTEKEGFNIPKLKAHFFIKILQAIRGRKIL